jgi:ketosteroid isomerase-like protein
MRIPSVPHPHQPIVSAPRSTSATAFNRSCGGIRRSPQENGRSCYNAIFEEWPMSDRAIIESVLRHAYAARQDGDLEGTLNVFHEHATFRIAGSSATCAAVARAMGADLRPALRKLINSYQWLSHTVLTMIIDNNCASVQWIAKLRHHPSGEVVETEAFDLWTFEGEKCVSLVEYIDTALAERLHTLAIRSESAALNDV